MKVIVKPHNIQIVSTPVNELEVNVTTVTFEFSEEITEDFVKEAYFTLEDNTYKQVIINNTCEIPNEVLTKVGTIELGVVAYYADPVNNELIRYNPKPGYFTSWEGSLRDAENSEPITPSEMEQFETALNDGLETLDNALDDLQEKVDTGYFDGEDGITPTIGDNGNWYLGEEDTGKPSRGEQGLPGREGQPGRDGYVQYTAGENITIDENNVISAEGSDLTDYVKNTDYASDNVAGVIATNSTYGVTTSNTGKVNALVRNYSTYSTASDNMFIGKGTLENVITGKDLADKTYVDNKVNSSREVFYVDYDTSSVDTPFVFDGKKRGIYYINSMVKSRFYYKWNDEGTLNYLDGSGATVSYIILDNDFVDSEIETGVNFGYMYYKQGDGGNCFRALIYKNSSNKLAFTNNKFVDYSLTNGTQTIGGAKTFSTIPKQNNTNAPTQDAQFTNKKYVDDAIASAITTTLGGSF